MENDKEGSQLGSTSGYQNSSGPISTPPTILQDGCYYIRYTPLLPNSETFFLEGTLRVLRLGHDGKLDPQGVLNAGADLYARLRDDPSFKQRDPEQWPAEGKPPRDQSLLPLLTKGIPIFPRGLYTYYLEVTHLFESTLQTADKNCIQSVTIEFAVYEFQRDVTWPNPGARSVSLKVLPTPSGDRAYPNTPNGSPLLLAGDVLDANNQTVGALTIGWIDTSLRRARVSVGRVDGIVFPGEKSDWEKAFGEAGWTLSIDDENKALESAADANGAWTTGGLQQALYIMRVREIVNSSATIKPKRKEEVGKLALETMSLSQIQAEIPELATLPDPLDNEWVYHLLCVPTVEGFPRGVLFDTYGSDSLNLPREGAAVAGKWPFGDEAQWGSAGLQELQAVVAPTGSIKPYFRVAVHEIGHAMGLDHNFKDEGFMNPTDSVAEDGYSGTAKRLFAEYMTRLISVNSPIQQGLTSAENKSLESRIQVGALVAGFVATRDAVATSDATPPNTATPPKGDVKKLRSDPERLIANEIATRLSSQAKMFAGAKLFPDNISPHFEVGDLKWLRFGPDVAIRPGTTFESYGPVMTDEAAVRADGLKLEVSPLLPSVPLGAPVRVQLRLRNTSPEPQIVPTSLDFKTGVIDGRVVNPDASERTFWPVKRWEDSTPGFVLPPGGTLTSNITLLRGAQKALFPTAGDHRIRVKANWEQDKQSVFVEDETSIHVADASDPEHRAAALNIFSTPDVLLSLAIVGDQFREGNDAVQLAMKNPVLRPHYMVVEAKRFFIGKPRASKTEQTQRSTEGCRLIDESTVMSFDEVARLCELLNNSYPLTSKPPPELQRAVAVLAQRIKQFLAQGKIELCRIEALKRKCAKIPL